MLKIIAIICIVFMYFVSGINKMINIDKTALGLEKRFPLKMLPLSFFRLTIICVVILQVCAPLTIIYSEYYKSGLGYFACLGLAIFTILATLLYHFPPFDSNYYSFMSNINAIGGLLLLSESYKKFI